MDPRIGFMQGRLSPPVNGRIQAFPAEHWRAEFGAAERLGLSLMEWTVDHEGFADNPIMTEAGRAEIRHLQHAHGLRVASLTADNMMQAPFWKAEGRARDARVQDFRTMIAACGALGAGLIVVPLVDDGALDTEEQEARLLDGLRETLPHLQRHGVRVAFESDFEPARLAALMAGLPEASFGINFDMGNSAALGWPPAEEIPLLAARIVNVHVKDRRRAGTTVPFGQGDVEFETVFRLLRAAAYSGAYIIQGARAPDGDDAGILGRYARRVEGLLHGG